MLSRPFALLISTFLFASLFAQTPAPAAADRPQNASQRHASVPAAVATPEAAVRQSEPAARNPHPASFTADSAAAGPNLTVDAAAGRHMISPYVYGINSYGLDQPSTIGALGIPITRWGGDGTSEYNWQLDKSNSGSDWYFEVFAQSGAAVVPPFDPVTFNNSAFDRFHAANQVNGARSIGTIPLLGWVAGNFPDKTCGYSVKKYGAQQKTDPYGPDCGNGITAAGAAILTNDPKDTDVAVNESYMTQWVQHVVGVFGPGARSGVSIWEMDNEPVWWSGVHQSVHPNPSTYDEVTSKGLSYSQAVKAADPTAAVAGAITSGWEDLFFSRVDLQSGWNSTGVENYKYWNNPTDRLAHGNMDFVAWYLQQFATYEAQHGQRLLDVFDIHGYMPGTDPTDSSGNELINAAANAQRLKSTRLYWDPNFIPYNDSVFNAFSDEYLLGSQWKQCLCLIPRMKSWVNTYYPGTKLAITEYYLGGQDDISGVLAEADLLGIFGREGLDIATWWPFHTVTATSPGGFSFRIYRNYDGRGSAFGQIGVSALSGNQDQLSIYAAQRSDQALTLMVINKTATDLSTTVALNHFYPAGPVRVYQYSAANLASIVPRPDLSVSEDPFFSPSIGIGTTFPAYSMTLLLIPESPSVRVRTPGVPRPVTPPVRAGASSREMQ
jgi:hypothetical protein